MYTQPSLQGRCHFGERVLSIFMVKIIANFKAVEGWGEKEICTKGVGDGPRGIQGKECGDINYISPFPTPYPLPHCLLEVEIKYGRSNKRSRAYKVNSSSLQATPSW